MAEPRLARSHEDRLRELEQPSADQEPATEPQRALNLDGGDGATPRTARRAQRTLMEPDDPSGIIDDGS